jgi:hypothetical protein
MADHGLSYHLASTGSVGIIIGLVGLAYRDIARRIGKCEEINDELRPEIAAIGEDVKLILGHCQHCKHAK